MKKYVLLFLIAFVALTAKTQTIKTWILAGQSNAEGYAITENPVRRLAPPTTLESINRLDLNTTHTMVKFYNGDNGTNTVLQSAGMDMSPKNSWHSMEPYEGLAFDWGSGLGRESGRRFGPELSFGYDVQQYLNEEIAIIKFARGSASIAPQTDPLNDGSYNDYDPTDNRFNQYDRLINTINGAVGSLSGDITLSLEGVLWMQGESDANSEFGSAYEANLNEFISELRTEISNIAAASNGKLVPGTSWNELKFFLGTIGNINNWGDTVRAAQNAVADADLNVYIIDAQTLPKMTKDDWNQGGIHIDTEGQVMLGERYANKVINLLSGGGTSVTGVSVSPTSANLNINDVVQLSETVQPSNATDKSVSWSSSNSAIATVDANGLVTAVAEGSTTITVTTNDGGFTATSTISVTTGNPGSTMHVVNIVEGTQSAGGPNNNGTATIYVEDNSGNPVANATVTGTFSGDFNETGSGVTGADGVVIIVTAGKLRGTPSFDFCVDDITHSSLNYAPGENVMTCSNGLKSASLLSSVTGDISSPIISIYPNPVSNGNVTLQFNNAISNGVVHMYNSLGKLVLSKPIIENELNLNVSGFKAGIYYVSVKGEAFTGISKLVVK